MPTGAIRLVSLRMRPSLAAPTVFAEYQRPRPLDASGLIYPQMSKGNHHTSHHTKFARALLVLLFLLLGAGDVAFWMFSVHPANPFPAMRGLVVGAALGSTAVIFALWFRKPMARTGLIMFIWLIIAGFSLPGLSVLNDRTIQKMEPLAMLAAGMGCYLVVNIILIASHSIHRLGMPRGCAG